MMSELASVRQGVFSYVNCEIALSVMITYYDEALKIAQQ